MKTTWWAQSDWRSGEAEQVQCLLNQPRLHDQYDALVELELLVKRDPEGCKLLNVWNCWTVRRHGDWKNEFGQGVRSSQVEHLDNVIQRLALFWKKRHKELPGTGENHRHCGRQGASNVVAENVQTFEPKLT